MNSLEGVQHQVSAARRKKSANLKIGKLKWSSLRTERKMIEEKQMKPKGLVRNHKVHQGMNMRKMHRDYFKKYWLKNSGKTQITKTRKGEHYYQFYRNKRLTREYCGKLYTKKLDNICSSHDHMAYRIKPQVGLHAQWRVCLKILFLSPCSTLSLSLSCTFSFPF